MALTHEQEKECATLKRLFSEQSQLTQKEFAAKFGLGTPGNLWQYLNARRALNLDVAVKFAAGLGIDVADFSPRLAARRRAGSGRQNCYRYRRFRVRRSRYPR